MFFVDKIKFLNEIFFWQHTHTWVMWYLSISFHAWLLLSLILMITMAFRSHTASLWSSPTISSCNTGSVIGMEESLYIWKAVVMSIQTSSYSQGTLCNIIQASAISLSYNFMWKVKLHAANSSLHACCIQPWLLSS